MSNWLAGKGRESLHQIWAEFVNEHYAASRKAWREVNISAIEVEDIDGEREAEYYRNLICCGWKHLAEEQSS